jgi:hypothetical protein
MVVGGVNYTICVGGFAPVNFLRDNRGDGVTSAPDPRLLQ